MVTTIDIQIQNDLRRLGLYSGTASGILDAPTKKAVTEFQKRYPWLRIDGIPGSMTKEELRQVISVLDGEEALKIFAGSVPQKTLTMEELDAEGNAILALAVQRRLRSLGLYPGGTLIDGDFKKLSQAALKKFYEEIKRPQVSEPLTFDSAAANLLLQTSQVRSVLEEASNQVRILDRLKTETNTMTVSAPELGGFKFGFLDMGASYSPFKETVQKYPEFLADLGNSLALPALPEYPKIGELPLPPINTNLLFLNEGITEACICIGEIADKKIKTRWLGRDATAPRECLSATKIIPILNVLCQIGSRMPPSPQVLILEGTEKDKFGDPIREVRSELSAMFIDICSYREGVALSNSRSATLNKFETARPAWIRKQTGNPEAIKFNGSYGGDGSSPLSSPKIFNGSSNLTILDSKSTASGENSISAYDLTRLISLVGWHKLLSNDQRLPNISDAGISQAITALSTDTARYVDIAFSTLGLENVIDSLVVLSKLGYGDSALIYTAYVQFIDKRESVPTLKTFSMTLRAKQNKATRPEGVRVDSAMAAGVAEIVRRIMLNDFPS